MKLLATLVSLWVALLASGQELPLAKPCDLVGCQPPDCRCSSTEIPGGLDPRNTPQFVLVTFDDEVTTFNIDTYRRVLYNRRNANGCNAEATFFVQHLNTNYQLVNELYNQGFEIALHSITHQAPNEYWLEAGYDGLMQEFGQQKIQMSYFANIPFDDIRGIRIPYLQMAGNTSFEIMRDVGLTYDCSMPNFFEPLNPGMWPYTLDYASTQECALQPCPTASFPGMWVLPMVSWLDTRGVTCAMVDTCFNLPDVNDEDAWFKFIVENFERHYLGNRSPFGFYAHEWYFSAHPVTQRALIRFLDMINHLEDVFMVQAHKVIEWTKNPVPLSEYNQSEMGRCAALTPRSCAANSCGPLHLENYGWTFWMSTCTSCPRVYPWLGNPFGL